VNVACRGGVEDGAAHPGLADGEVEAAETAGDEEERDGRVVEAGGGRERAELGAFGSGKKTSRTRRSR
jgi:hypothetical protein